MSSSNVIQLGAAPADNHRARIEQFLGITLPVGISVGTDALNYLSKQDLESLLLERPPFFMIGKAVGIGVNEVMATAHISEERCAGHMPGRLIVPLIRMCECATQTALVLAGLHATGDQAPIAIGSGPSRAHARDLVKPPVTLLIHAKRQAPARSDGADPQGRDRRHLVDAAIWVGEELVGTLDSIECVLMNKRIVLRTRRVAQ